MDCNPNFDSEYGEAYYEWVESVKNLTPEEYWHKVMPDHEKKLYANDINVFVSKHPYNKYLKTNNMKTIEIKKSFLAMHKGLGTSNADIAKNLGINQKELTKALLHFGLMKTRGGSAEAEEAYEIVHTNDIDIAEVNNQLDIFSPEAQVETEVATVEAEFETEEVTMSEEEVEEAIEDMATEAANDEDFVL